MNVIENSYTVESEDLDNVFAHWQQAENFLPWDCLFVLPVWLKTWWENFGGNAALYLLSVRHEGRTIGIAPLQRRNDTVRFIGDKSVCDNLDFIVDPNNAAGFYHRLITYLMQDGVKRLELEPSDLDELEDRLKAVIKRNEAMFLKDFNEWLAKNRGKIKSE